MSVYHVTIGGTEVEVSPLPADDHVLAVIVGARLVADPPVPDGHLHGTNRQGYSVCFPRVEGGIALEGEPDDTYPHPFTRYGPFYMATYVE